MIRYETLILAHPNCTDENWKVIRHYYENITSQYKGNVLSFDIWGKYRLSYPVKKNDYGIYCLVRFELPEDAISKVLHEIRDFFHIKCAETVMRSINKRLMKDAPLEYQKPEAIVSSEKFDRENAPSKEKEEDTPLVDPSLLSKAVTSEQILAE